MCRGMQLVCHARTKFTPQIEPKWCPTLLADETLSRFYCLLQGGALTLFHSGLSGRYLWIYNIDWINVSFDQRAYSCWQSTDHTVIVCNICSKWPHFTATSTLFLQSIIAQHTVCSCYCKHPLSSRCKRERRSKSKENILNSLYRKQLEMPNLSWHGISESQIRM